MSQASSNPRQSPDLRVRGLLSTHLAVLLFGVAGLFGKLLALTPALIVLGRTFFAALTILMLVLIWRSRFTAVRAVDAPRFALLGALLAVHWVTFFHSIQVSTVAIGLLTYSTFPIFVTFLEPVFFGGRPRTRDVLISFVVVLGLALVIPEFDLSNRLTEGAFWGVISGLSFALLTVLNRRFVARHSSLTIAGFQNGFAFLWLLPFAGASATRVTAAELGLLLILGVVFTALAHTLFIAGLKGITARLASLISSLESVYGIVLALLLLSEVPSMRELAGGTIIIGSIVYATRASRTESSA